MVESLHRHKYRSLIMEGIESPHGRAHVSHFKRIIAEHDVGQFFVFWPYGAQRAGLDVEFGYLLNLLDDGDSLDVRLFVEERAGSIEGDRFVAREKGRRTTYYEDFVSFGCPIIEWEGYDALWDAVVHHADSE